MKLYIDLKPELEWEDFQNQKITSSSIVLIARCGYGRYLITQSREVYLQDYVTFSLGVFETLERAQASAQADYDRRTAERFKEVEVPEQRDLPYEDGNGFNYSLGYNRCLEDLNKNINRARKGKL